MKHCQIIILAGLLSLSALPGASANSISSKIDRIVDSAGLPKDGLSIQIKSLKDGRIVYQRNPNLLLNPASNVKLITAASALHYLGPDFTFKTEFYSEGPIDRQGRLRNLWIRGTGDPILVTEEIESIVRELHTKGLREIQGDVQADDSHFDRNHLTTYFSEKRGKVYSIMTGPLSFNFNSSRTPAWSGLRLGDQRIRARKVSRKKMKISDPALFAGSMLVQALEKAGIRVRGHVKRGVVPSHVIVILNHISPPMREVLKGMGKFSNNFIAEQLVKVLGAERLGEPGSTEKGLKVIRTYLSSQGIPQDSYTLDNGSGLSRDNRFSASQFVSILSSLYHSSMREETISFLSVAGIDGTMRRKMRKSPLTGKVFAKTGTLNDVSALSGYVLDGNKELVFSFLFNGRLTPKLSRIEEKILRVAHE